MLHYTVSLKDILAVAMIFIHITLYHQNVMFTVTT